MNPPNNGPMCAAPPLTEELLAEYKTLAEGAEPEVKEAMLKLHACCMKWWDLPVSTAAPTREHVFTNGQKGDLIPLTTDLQAALWDDIPWMRELVSMGHLFDERINPVTQPNLANAAHHLVWHCKELCNDREPVTLDKLR